MAMLPVEQGNDHPLGLGGCDGWNEVAVPGDQHGLSNVALGGELHHIDAKQDVHSLLLIERPSLRVLSPTLEAPEPYFETRQHSQRIVESASLRVSLALLPSWRIILVWQAVVVVGTENILSASHLDGECAKVNSGAIEFILQNSVQVPSINEYSYTTGQALLSIWVGRLFQAALRRA